jgi:hypothetical protein
VRVNTIDNVRRSDNPTKRQFELWQVNAELSADISDRMTARTLGSVNHYWPTIACRPRSVFDVFETVNDQRGPRLANSDDLPS